MPTNVQFLKDSLKVKKGEVKLLEQQIAEAEKPKAKPATKPATKPKPAAKPKAKITKPARKTVKKAARN